MPIDGKSFCIFGIILLAIVTLSLIIPIGMGYYLKQFELGIVIGSVIAAISIIFFSGFLGDRFEKIYMKKEESTC